MEQALTVRKVLENNQITVMAFAAPFAAVLLWAVLSAVSDFFVDLLEIFVPLMMIGAVVGAVLWGRNLRRSSARLCNAFIDDFVNGGATCGI